MWRSSIWEPVVGQNYEVGIGVGVGNVGDTSLILGRWLG